MHRHSAGEMTRGLLWLLLAAFVLLFGFVVLVMGVTRVDLPRIILAFVLIALALLLLRAGHAGLVRAAATADPPTGAGDTDPASGTSTGSGEGGDDRSRPDDERSDDPMDP